jgi:hypothetical protein
MSKTSGMFNIQNTKLTTPSKVKSKKMEEGEIVIKKSTTTTNKSSKYSSEDINKLLKGYKSVPIALWGELSYGTHMRYIRTDGRFVRGGFNSGYIESNGRKLVNIANGFNASIKGYSAWTIALNSIKTLYIKVDVILPQKPKEISINPDLKTIIQNLQKRIITLESKKH